MIVTFVRKQRVSDGQGGSTVDFVPLDGLERIPAEYKPERGQERIEAGRVQAEVAGTLRVRSCAAVRDVTASDFVILHEIDGDVTHAIRADINPDQRNRFVEFTIERGVALK